MFEKARGPDRLLTDWRNGRRFVWIDLPTVQIKKSLKMGSFSASLYYREMKNTLQCRRCLREGHKAIDCPNEEVCLSCKLPGHRKGDRECGHNEEVRSLAVSNHDDENDYTDLWWGGVTNGKLSSASANVVAEENAEKEGEGDHMDNVVNKEGNTERDHEIVSSQQPNEQVIVDITPNKLLGVRTDREEKLNDEERGKGNEVSDKTVNEEQETVENLVVTEEAKETAEAKEDESVKVSEIEEGEILEDNDKGSMITKVSYKEKLIGSPSKEKTKKSKKGKESGNDGSDGNATPLVQKGMVQSILNFVGKRSSDTLSPDSTETRKPNSKRQAKQK